MCAMEAPARGEPETIKDAQVGRLPRDQGGRPGALRPRPVRRLPLDRRRRPGLDHRDVRGAAARDRELALGRRPVLHPHGQAAPGDADRAAARVQAPAAARLRRRSTARCSRTSSSSSSTPRPAIRLDRRGAPGRRPRLDRARHGVRGRGRRGADALRGAPPRRDGRRDDALHAPGRRRGDVARDAAPARLAAARAPVRAGLLGTEGGRRSSSPGTGAGTAPGSAHDRRGAARSSRRRRAQRRRRPSRRSPTTRSCRTATPARSSPRTARSTGCACPSFDSPSVFASLLDRQAGFFRLGPFGINHPSSREYEPGTNVLVTTWKTPSGWIVGPRRADDGAADARGHGHAAHAAAGGRRRRPHARSHGRVHRGLGRGRARLRAGLRLRPGAGAVDARRRRPDEGRRDRRRRDDPPRLRPSARGRGQPGARAPHAASRRAGLLRALLGGRARRAEGRRRGGREDGRDDPVLARLARARPDPRPPLPRADPALGARDQGTDVHADRRDRRRADDVAARDPGRRAQLGLPLHLDARHDLHAPGAPLAQPRLGGRRVHGVRRRHRADRGRVAADHVRDRRQARPDRVDARPPLGLRGRPSRPRSATARTTSARTTSSARCSTRSCSTRSAASGCRGGCGRSSSRRRSARRRCGGSPTRASGRPAAPRSTTSRRS